MRDRNRAILAITGGAALAAAALKSALSSGNASAGPWIALAVIGIVAGVVLLRITSRSYRLGERVLRRGIRITRQDEFKPLSNGTMRRVSELTIEPVDTRRWWQLRRAGSSVERHR